MLSSNEFNQGTPMFTRRTFIGLAAALPAAALITRPAMASEPPFFSDMGLAIRGADPVAFFTEGAPVIGSADHALMWEGTMWHFASAENMETFEMNPTLYAPQYGGYCAFAMARGYIASTVPEAWSIVDGRLYLNYSVRVRDRWSRDIPGNIAAADANWPGILDA